MRARTPDREGVVQRDGVRVAFEIFGHGGPALLLIPASPITHARSWKGVVPALAPVHRRHDRWPGHRTVRPPAHAGVLRAAPGGRRPAGGPGRGRRRPG